MITIEFSLSVFGWNDILGSNFLIPCASANLPFK